MKQRVSGVVKYIPKNQQSWQDAFAPGQNFGDPSTMQRWQTPTTPQQRAAFTNWARQQGTSATYQEELQVYKRDNPSAPFDPDKAYGYIKTKNSMKINAVLYDPKNAGKTVDQMKGFRRPDDRKTVKTLDSMIAKNTIKQDALFTRYLNPYVDPKHGNYSLNDTLQKTYGLTAQQAQMLLSAPKMNKAQLSQLSKSMAGIVGRNPAFSSTSANRTMNVFQNFPIMEEIKVKAGTNAFICGNNPKESEVIFGRGMTTKITGVRVETINNRTHVVLEKEIIGFNP